VDIAVSQDKVLVESGSVNLLDSSENNGYNNQETVDE